MTKNLAVALTCVAFGASALAVQNAPIGYDDTPMQPDGKWRVHDSKRPRPDVVTPGTPAFTAPPADAIVLLGADGDMSQWQAVNGGPVRWTVANGVAETGRGTIQTKEEFSDVQLHLEFATPIAVKGDSQGRGNSGVYLAGAFEIQVLDSYNNPSYADGQAASMYGQFPPLVNASRPPGEWQTYDIAFTAPTFTASGELATPAVVTVLHNGVLVHNAREFWGPTAHRRIDPYVPANAKGPIRLQDHQNPVRYRNIWVRRLSSRQLD